MNCVFMTRMNWQGIYGGVGIGMSGCEGVRMVFQSSWLFKFKGPFCSAAREAEFLLLANVILFCDSEFISPVFLNQTELKKTSEARQFSQFLKCLKRFKGAPCPSNVVLIFRYSGPCN